MNFCPKFNFIYYKNLVECAMREYFSVHNDDFSRDSGKYVESKVKSRQRVRKEIERYVCSTIRNIMKPYDMSDPNYYFIIGSYYPRDNILLECVNEDTNIPRRLMEIIAKKPNLKYVLRENDIEIDIDTYNSVFEDIFNDFLTKPIMSKKLLKEYSNLHFIKHGRLGCYMLWRMMKMLYGSSNVKNMYREHGESMSRNLISVNEELEKCFTGKKELVKSERFGIISKEVKQRVESCIRKTQNAD